MLLVATHKRQAAVNEIQRLKTEGGLGADPAKDNSVRGTVSLCGINLGLKKEFVQQVRVATKNLKRFSLGLIKESFIKGEG